MEDEKYVLPKSKFNEVILDLLIDVLANQMAFRKLLSERFQMDAEAIENNMEESRLEARSALIDAILLKHGDLSSEIKDLLNPPKN